MVVVGWWDGERIMGVAGELDLKSIISNAMAIVRRCHGNVHHCVDIKSSV